jgi:hypothetical protein
MNNPKPTTEYPTEPLSPQESEGAVDGAPEEAASEGVETEVEPREPVEELREKVEKTVSSLRARMDRVASRYEKAYALTENLLRVGKRIFPEKISDDHMDRLAGFHGQAEELLDRARGMIDHVESGAQAALAHFEGIGDPQAQAAAAETLNTSLDRLNERGSRLVEEVKAKFLTMVFRHPRTWSPSEDLAG